jgi:hypothetical protein
VAREQTLANWPPPVHEQVASNKPIDYHAACRVERERLRQAIKLNFATEESSLRL